MEKTYTITPYSEYGIQSFPLVEGNMYTYSESEFKELKTALRNKTKHFEFEEYEVEEPVYETQTADEVMTDENGETKTVQTTKQVQTGTKTVKKTRGVLKDCTPPTKTEAELKAEYEKLTVKYIRLKYSADDENKILREKCAGTDNGEFDEYNTYVEECKVKAHKEVYGV
jgi:hypothetical protein